MSKNARGRFEDSQLANSTVRYETMDPVLSHSWNPSIAEAFVIQQSLSAKVIRADSFDTIHYVAGVDVAYEKEGDRFAAAAIVLEADSLAIAASVTATGSVEFPYTPGLFSFREIPPILQALSQLAIAPDLIVCDGQGVAHPRRFGLACHLGVLLDVPTIGCGKTCLVGAVEQPERERGSFASLVDKGEEVGRVLRTQDGIKPLYISIGHKVSLETACDWILTLTPKYRLPQTTRLADQLVRHKLKALPEP